MTSLYFLSFQPKLDLVGVSFFITTTQLIIFISITCLRKVSIGLIYQVFSLIFMNLLPWLHYTNDTLIWRQGALAAASFYELNFVLFICNSIVFTLQFVKVKPILSPQNHDSLPGINTRTVSAILLALSGIGFSVVLAINGFSLTELMFRGLIDEIKGNTIENSSLSLLVTMCARLTPYFCFVYAVTQIKDKTTLKVALFLLMLMSAFPTGVPRYMVAFIYLPIALIFIKKLRDGLFFTMLLVFSLIFIFPLLDQFRYFSGFENLRFVPDVGFFFAAHFDAYENMASAMEGGFISHGRQLLGVVFFYIPRAIWESKPVGSGYEMANQFGYIFNNISMPFLGEGYVNFGMPGIFAFAFLFGLLASKIDRYFVLKTRSTSTPDFSVAFYFYLLGGTFFVMRGDLISSTAYLSSGVFIAFVLAKTTKAINRIRVK